MGNISIDDVSFPPIDTERKKDLRLFESHAGIRFKKQDFLNLAFCHRSYSNENQQKIDNNEKLEFLGDSILGMIISEYLYLNLPEKVEGDLARIKSFVVSEDSLAQMARKLRVENYVLIGHGEECSGGRQKKAILADCMEAIIGAYYLDSGFKAVKKFVLSYLVEEIEKVLSNKHRKDYKTLLQEYVQKHFKSYPKYILVKRTGPDHNRTFWMNVKVGSKEYGPGKGKNKKEAEQHAAGIAFNSLEADDS